MMTASADRVACHGCGHEALDAAVEWLDPATWAPDPDWGEPFCPECAPPGLALEAA